MPLPEPSPTPRPAWAEKVERGTLGALQLMARAIRGVGRRRMRWILHPIAAYFLTTDRAAREASREYFARLGATTAGAGVLGRAPGWRDTYRQLHEFSISIFDRLRLFAGIDGDFVFDHEGPGHFAHLPDAEGPGSNALGKSGALILGAHIGTFEMMRSICQDADVPVSAVVYGANAQTIQSFFQALDSDFELDVIHVEPGSKGAALEIRAAVERGHFVAILADRVGIEGGGRRAVEILGAPAPLPEGPFQLATLIGCPVMLATALRVGDAHYRVTSEPLYAGGRVPRAERDKVVAELMDGYARYVERTCLAAPHQWFNFFSFWEA